VITEVLITKQALKDLKRTPKHLQEKFRAWLVAINKIGLMETRKSPGWHDEPLKEERAGQRSIG
jgi:proteic killer suppression protein